MFTLTLIFVLLVVTFAVVEKVHKLHVRRDMEATYYVDYGTHSSLEIF